MVVTSKTESSVPTIDRGEAAASVLLPARDGSIEPYRLHEPLELETERGASAAAGEDDVRRFYAAPHVVGQPLSGGNRSVDAIDWDETMRFRDHLWDTGLGVAEAMDTAQRGMGLDWTLAQELIARTGARAAERGARLVSGAATDQLGAPRSEGETHPLEAIVDAYVEQCEFIAQHGGTPVIMASRDLARAARTTADYRTVYDQVLAQSRGPVILHWLGEMFDPSLSGYWGADDLDTGVDAVTDLIDAHANVIEGIKVSVLSSAHEIALRDRLPAGVRLYTGDDFNYPELIKGDGRGHSDALLGIFNPLASIAAASLAALNEGDLDRYDALMDPTVPLARLLFAEPTQHYKCGVVFLAYLNGHQTHFKMIHGQEGNRSVAHYAEVFRLADVAGALVDPALAAERMRAYLTIAGIQGD